VSSRSAELATTTTVRFFDPARTYAAQRDELRAAFESVMESDRLVLGAEVEQFEREFGALIGSRYAIGVASGTDAIELALRALALDPGSEVICPNLTAPATGVGILRAGLTPVLVDVDPRTLTLSAELAAEAIGPNTAAILAVHLYGRPAPMTELLELGLPLIEDCAQAHGLEINRARAGSIGRFGCFSFYPTKNLGAFGDAGVVTTSDPELAERVHELCRSGKATDGLLRRPAFGSRLDELQAALLRVRLPRLPQENARRAEIARTYDQAAERPSPHGVHHLYVLRTRRRGELRVEFARAGIQTEVHYPHALSEHPVFASSRRAGTLEESKLATAEVCSLPCYQHLSSAEEEHIGATLERLRAHFRFS
jgi:dTDP-3-amino-3,4,6-trideoxy-alpha-D-glucose transaminase